MEDVFVERVLPEPLTEETVRKMLSAGAACMDLHGVDWRESLLAADGRRMLCRMQAPDAESVRLALRQARAAFDLAWSGSVHVADPPRGEPRAGANVVVERSFREPVSLEAVRALGKAGTRCLEMHAVTFLRTFFSRDRRRMVCLYRAPDTESVRHVQRQAGMGFDRVWACRWLRPAATDSDRG